MVEGPSRAGVEAEGGVGACGFGPWSWDLVWFGLVWTGLDQLGQPGSGFNYLGGLEQVTRSVLVAKERLLCSGEARRVAWMKAELPSYGREGWR